LYCSDEALKEFYYEFMVSEAGHYTLFLDLARTFFFRRKGKVPLARMVAIRGLRNGELDLKRG